MRAGPHVVLRAAAKLHTPLILLFAFSLLAMRAPGAGIGFVAGLALALALVLHVIVFGAAAARAAFPAPLARALLGLGVIGALIGAGAPNLQHAPQIAEAGLFLATVSALALVIDVLAGRAPTLRDEDW
ncbi:MAG: MnhB domain-containing protein [Terricaulis sp.]